MCLSLGNSKKPGSYRDDYSIIPSRVLIKQYLWIHVIWKFLIFLFKSNLVFLTHSSAPAFQEPPNFLSYFIHVLQEHQITGNGTFAVILWFFFVCQESFIIVQYQLFSPNQSYWHVLASISLLCRILNCQVKRTILLVLKIILCLLQSF